MMGEYARSMRLCVLVVVLGACESSKPDVMTPPAVGPKDSTKRIEDLKPIVKWRDANAPYDCTIVAALRQFAPGTRVEDCGLLERDSPKQAVAASLACAQRAVQKSQPVVFAQAVQGTDSAIAVANLARIENGRYVGYAAHYDSDPCGGSCSELGGTRIIACRDAPRTLTDCPDNRGVCLACEGEIVERCRHGTPSASTLVVAEQARDRLFGPTASFGPALGPLQLGAPFADWTSPGVQKAIAEIKAGGIAWIVQDRPPFGPTIDSIALDFAGPCRQVRARSSPPIASDSAIAPTGAKIPKM